MKTFRIIMGIVVALSLAVPALAQQKQPSNRMFKCVDDNGKVYYSDIPRQDCSKGSEMNRQGVVIKKRGDKPAATAVTKPGKDEAKKPELAPGARRDRALMATYTTEQEIDAARDRSLALPEQAVKTAEARLDKANKDLFELKKQADALAAQQKPLPGQLLEDVSAKQKDVSALEAEAAQKKAQANAIRDRYDADKQRFHELKSRTASTN